MSETDWSKHLEYYSKPAGFRTRWEIYPPDRYSPLLWLLRRVEFIEAFDTFEEAKKYAEEQTKTQTAAETP